MEKDIDEKFISFGDLIEEVVDHRNEIDIDNACKFGVDILDDYLGGITDNDLVVLGADTGVGKSDLAYKIAIKNAERGKKVLLFSLEGDIYEIIYRYLQNKINLDGKGEVRTVDYRFNLKDLLDRESDAIAKTSMNIMNNILIYKKEAIPDIEEIVEHIQNFRNSVDMIVLDHLHYISFGDSRSEQESIGKIMRELKMTTDILRKPIVLVAHLRKRKNIEEDPNIFDFHGSSNIGKEATTVLLLKKEDKINIESCCNHADIMEDRRYAGTKALVVKSRPGLPPAKFNLVYDVISKMYIDELSEIANDSSITKKDLISYG